jgi:hypothetical protein
MVELKRLGITSVEELSSFNILELEAFLVKGGAIRLLNSAARK